MKPNRKCYNLTFILAICAGVFCASYCVLSVANERGTALYRVNMHKNDVQGWEACRKTQPALFRENQEAVTHSLKSLEEAQASFWAGIPTRELIGLYIAGAVAGTFAGFVAALVLAKSTALAARALIKRLRAAAHAKANTEGPAPLPANPQ